MIEADDPRLIRSKRKPINGLVPYAIHLARGRQQRVADLIMFAFSASHSKDHWRWPWGRIDPYITPIFNNSSPPSLNRAIIFISPYVFPIFDPYDRRAAAIRWVAAVIAVPCSEELVPSVVQKLLEITVDNSLRPCVPLDVWVWLKKRPSLPPYCPGRWEGDWRDVAEYIRQFEDIEILTSYLFLVWSEWEDVRHWNLKSVRMLIREDLGGIGVWRNRQELIERLDQIFGQLGRGLEYLQQHDARIDEGGIQQRKEQYGELKEALLEVDRRAIETLTRMPLELILLSEHTDSVGVHRIPFNLCLCSASPMNCHPE